MTFDALHALLGGLPFFDLATVAQAFRQPRTTLLVQLHRWIKSGKLLALRRGMYAWAERYQRGPLNPAVLANALYRPSCLSGLWALSFYGLIPEKVVQFTSVTTRSPRRFVNALGVFDYRHLKREAFFGCVAARVMDDEVFLARPEKALLDFWYLSKGPWTSERLQEMRFQNTDLVKPGLLRRFARRYGAKRMAETVRLWETTIAAAERESVVL